MRRSGGSAAALGRLALAGLFTAVPRMVYAVEVHGLEHDARAPATYFATSHKRDLDSVAPVPAIVGHHGWRALTGDVHFSMRADAFEPGFLARVLVARPARFLLRPLALGPVLRGLGIQPLRDLRLYPAEAWIREALRAEGDCRAGDVLAPPFIERLASATGVPASRIAGRPLSRLLRWRYHAALQMGSGADLFIGAARRRAELRAAQAVKEQLDALSAWLRDGGSLYGAPEGRLSPDGRLSPITSGLHRVLRGGPPDARLIPLFVVYDFMTTHRPRAFVDLAPAIADVAALPPRELEARLRRSWLLAARFTCTQLAAGYLVEAARRAAALTLEDLAQALHEQAMMLAAAGRHVDARLLQRRGARHAAVGFLAYAVRQGLAHRAGREVWRASVVEDDEAVPDLPPWQGGYSRAPLRYAWNELREMLAADAAPTMVSVSHHAQSADLAP